MKIIMRLFFIILLFFGYLNVIFSQESNKNFSKKDTLISNYQLINDSLQLWSIDKNTRILKSKNKTFIWHKINQVDYWKIDENISAFHLIDYKLKLWLKDDSLKIWKENAIKNYTALFFNIENKFKKWQFNDSLQLIFYHDTFSLWKVNPFTTFYKLSFLDNVLYMSDTSKLWLISDSLFLWTKKDSTALWEKKYEPQSWVISSSTKVWNINDSIEYWLSEKKMNFWKENKLTGNWVMLDTVNNWLLGDTSKLYKLDPQTIVINKNEKVCIWKLSKQLVYSILDDKNGKVWKIKPPPPKLMSVDTVLLPENKQIVNFYIDNNTQLWNLSDSIKIWRIKEKIEVWQKNNHFKIWQVDDSTKIINLYDKIRLTVFHNKVFVWQRNDSLGEWKKIKTAKQWKYFGTDLNTIWEVNDTLKYSENDSISMIWNISENYKIAHIEESWRGIEVWKHPDNIEVWNIDPELKFWSENNTVSAWKKDNYTTFMQANDSTKVWQINSEIRLSQVNDVLKIWKRIKTDEGYKWLISNEFKPVRFQYQGKPMVIKIYDNLQIWQHNKIVSFWKRDLTRKILTINDIMKVYSFVPEYFTPKEKRKSNWKIGGVGGLDFSQAYFKDWVKGGESKLALLSSLKFYGNYEKDKVKWNNELVLKLGTIKPGENRFRKNEDNIELSTNFGLKASKYWHISVNSNTSTQFLAGYNYPNDSIPVSKFLSPIKHIGGFGANYTPNKNLLLFISPLSFKSTFVRDTSVGQVKYGIETGKKSSNEIGFQFKADWKHKLFKDIDLATKLSLFSSYIENPEKIDIDWETTIYFQLNKYVKTTLFNHILYDYDIKIPQFDDDGKEIAKTDAVQLKQTLSVGFSYNF